MYWVQVPVSCDTMGFPEHKLRVQAYGSMRPSQEACSSRQVILQQLWVQVVLISWDPKVCMRSSAARLPTSSDQGMSNSRSSGRGALAMPTSPGLTCQELMGQCASTRKKLSKLPGCRGVWGTGPSSALLRRMCPKVVSTAAVVGGIEVMPACLSRVQRVTCPAAWEPLAGRSARGSEKNPSTLRGGAGVWGSGGRGADSLSSMIAKQHITDDLYGGLMLSHVPVDTWS